MHFYGMYFNVDYKPKQEDWREFERTTAKIFESLDYTVKPDVRFKTSRRFQIDLIAYKENRCFFVDCKDHVYIAPSEEERFVLEQKFRIDNFIMSDERLPRMKKFVLLVTKNKANSLMFHEDSKEKVLSVDLQDLPELLRNIELYEDELYYF